MAVLYDPPACRYVNDTAVRQQSTCRYFSSLPRVTSGVGVRLKVGGINIEKSKGVVSGEGLCPP